MMYAIIWIHGAKQFLQAWTCLTWYNFFRSSNAISFYVNYNDNTMNIGATQDQACFSSLISLYAHIK